MDQSGGMSPLDNHLPEAGSRWHRALSPVGHRYLFVKLHGQSPSLQKILHYHFRLRISLPDQAAHKAVGAGIGPIRLVQPAFQKTGNRPGIINARQQAPLHIRIGLEGGIEKTADELRQLFPISVCVGFLQRRVVLVQENQRFFPWY